MHEYAHARVARLQGDSTAEQAGRLTLNPISHIDPIGTIFVPLILLIGSRGTVGFGWAKPVPVNPYAFRHPRSGVFWVSIAGPLSNIALALAVGIVLRLTEPYFGRGPSTPLQVILYSVVAINLYLAFFNLIPLPPLDGSGVLASLLPLKYAQKYEGLGRFGTMLLMFLIIIGGLSGFPIIRGIIGGPAGFLFRLFTGHGF